MKARCLLFGHKWDGCRCQKCGTIAPAAQHDWDGCVCKRCGAQAAEDSLHDWELIKQESTKSESDEWYGGHFVSMTSVTEVNTYRCRRCGRERQDVHTGIE